MVLSETIWRFFARLRRSSSNRSSGSSSGGVAGEDMEERSGDRVSGTAAGGFMCSARMASSLIMTRAVSIKRKLDEVETGMLESSASSVNSNARARREREAFSGENFRSANQDSEGNFPNAMQGFARDKVQPGGASGVNPGHLSYFKFCGRVIGLALMHRVQIDMVLARTFFKQLAGLSISWEDTQDADPYLYSSCKKILEMDPDLLDEDLLGLTFVTEVEELGSRKVMELCPGGRDLVVNSKNRHQYVKLLIQCHFVTPVAEQIKCFAQGFSDLLGNSTLQQFLRALEPEDLDLMLYGKGHDLCVQDWKDHTEYHEYTEADNQIIWFWQVVSGMTMEQRRRLIFFSTSLTHLPPEGFSGLPSKFHIHKAHTNLSWLPIAHTCFYQLVLPPYTSFEMMHARLHAITEIHIAEGFGFA